MALDTAQRELWETMGTGHPTPSGDQTPEQARALAIDAFRMACALDGLDRPTDADIRDAEAQSRGRSIS